MVRAVCSRHGLRRIEHRFDDFVASVQHLDAMLRKVTHLDVVTRIALAAFWLEDAGEQA